MSISLRVLFSIKKSGGGIELAFSDFSTSSLVNNCEMSEKIVSVKGVCSKERERSDAGDKNWEEGVRVREEGVEYKRLEGDVLFEATARWDRESGEEEVREVAFREWGGVE